MLRDHRGVDAAADVELGGEAHVAGGEGAAEVVEDLVGHGLVEGPLVPEGPDVELEGLELDAQPVRDVLEGEDREVGLASLRAQAGELGNPDADGVVPLGLGVGEGLQFVAGLSRHGRSGRMSAKKREYTE